MLIVNGFHSKLNQDKQRRQHARENIDSFLRTQPSTLRAGRQLDRKLSVALVEHVGKQVFSEHYDLIEDGMFELVAKLSDIDMCIQFFEEQHKAIQAWWRRILITDTEAGLPAQKLSKILMIPECAANDIEAVVLRGDFAHPMFLLTANTMTQFLAARLAVSFSEHLKGLP